MATAIDIRYYDELMGRRPSGVDPIALIMEQPAAFRCGLMLAFAAKAMVETGCMGSDAPAVSALLALVAQEQPNPSHGPADVALWAMTRATGMDECTAKRNLNFFIARLSQAHPVLEPLPACQYAQLPPPGWTAGYAEAMDR